MARGRPRKYKTKKLSKEAKRKNTKMFVTHEVLYNTSWYQRKTAKRKLRALLENLEGRIIKNLEEQFNECSRSSVSHAGKFAFPLC